MHYDLSPDQLAEHLARFVTEYGVRAVGGCCGTTPAHLAAVVSALAPLVPAARHPELEPAAASIYSSTPYRQDTSVLLVGERTNANGSKKFRDAMLAGDWDACVAIGRDQIKEGAHVLDVCVDYTGADGAADMDQLMRRLATQSSVPVMVDTTEAAVARAALTWLGGKPLLNSVNLEEGDAEGTRLDRFLTLAAEFGAGGRRDLHRRGGPGSHRGVEGARGAPRRRPGGRALRALRDDLFIDCARAAALDRHGGVAPRRHRDDRGDPPWSKADAARGAHDPGALQHLLRAQRRGAPGAQQRLPARVRRGRSRRGDRARGQAPAPPARARRAARAACLDLIYDRRREGYDPLAELLSLFEGAAAPATSADELADLPAARPAAPAHRRRPAPRARGRPRRGDGRRARRRWASSTTSCSTGCARSATSSRSGEMQLPFVLQSAETMKAAVSHLEPHMEKTEDVGRGRVVLATVKGDVHDIGKNLVDIILTNNGYEVVNLGIKVGINEMLAAVEEHRADALGMSGLLVKSTLIMRENLEVMNEREMSHVDVLLGGAALTRTYVERDLRQVLPRAPLLRQGRLRGAARPRAPGRAAPRRGRRRRVRARRSRSATSRAGSATSARARGAARAQPRGGGRQPALRPAVRRQPGRARASPIDEIAEYLNLTALFRNQWGYRPEEGEDDAAFKVRVGAVLREQLGRAKEEDLLVPQVVWGHFPAAADGDDLVVYADESRATEAARFTFPRQARRRTCASPTSSGRSPAPTPTTRASCSSRWARASRSAAARSSRRTATAST